jgi:hypothetical protein
LREFAPFQKAEARANQQGMFGENPGEIVGSGKRGGIELPPQANDSQGTLFRGKNDGVTPKRGAGDKSTQPKQETPAGAETITREQAIELRRKGLRSPAEPVNEKHMPPGEYVHTNLPLSAFIPDMADGMDIDHDAVQRYAKMSPDSAPPVYATFGADSEKYGAKYAYVHDGQHRIAAAQLRGDDHVDAVLPKEDYARLIGKKSSDTSTPPSRGGDLYRSKIPLLAAAMKSKSRPLPSFLRKR